MKDVGYGLEVAIFFELACLISLDEALKLFPLEPKFYAFTVYFDKGCFKAKSFSEFLPIFYMLVVLAFWEIWGETGCVDPLVYWSMKFLAGGQAKVLLGIVFGMGSLIKGSLKTY